MQRKFNCCPRFFTHLKESNAKRQNTLLALDLIQRGLALLACKFESAPTTQGSSLDEKRICDIVREAVSSQLCNTTAAPTYGAIAARAPTLTPAGKQVPVSAPAPPKFKMTIIPEPDCPGIHTAEDSKKILQSRAPRDYGIRVDEIVAMKDNAVLLDSRCDSILKLADSQILKDLRLKAVPIKKRWPRMLIADVPASVTQYQLVETLSGQNLTDSYGTQ
jgi:hypothetical protein